MIGCYDFCGHYEWTFAWLEQVGEIALVREYWEKAISEDSQKHAREKIVSGGIAGMKQYWQHTLEEEAAGYAFSSNEKSFRIDMLDCPSKGFLLRNGLRQYSDYCDHCIGWIGPMMKDAGFSIDHEHNHCGQCWWEFRRKDKSSDSPQFGAMSGPKDVRLLKAWKQPGTDIFKNANDDQNKHQT